MLMYVLIGLCLTLAGVAGLQMTYMLYLERLDRERKLRLRELELKCIRLSAKLDEAEQLLAEQEAMIATLYSDVSDEDRWAEVIEET